MSGAVGDVGYVTKYHTEKYKEGEVVENHVFTVSSVGILYPGQVVKALHILYHQ
jgi:hypothetical protein